jgi:hypothetical protein
MTPSPPLSHYPGVGGLAASAIGLAVTAPANRVTSTDAFSRRVRRVFGSVRRSACQSGGTSRSISVTRPRAPLGSSERDGRGGKPRANGSWDCRASVSAPCNRASPAGESVSQFRQMPTVLRHRRWCSGQRDIQIASRRFCFGLVRKISEFTDGGVSFPWKDRRSVEYGVQVGRNSSEKS